MLYMNLNFRPSLSENKRWRRKYFYDVKTRCGYQFLGAIIIGNIQHIEMKFEAFEL